MIDSITISHDECVEKIIKLANTITMEHVTKAFLCSLSTRRLDWRSAISSYYIAKLFTEHKYTPAESGRFYDGDAVVHISYTYATYWRGEDGYDKALVDKYFRKYWPKEEKNGLI